jgi:hypothetical protein
MGSKGVTARAVVMPWMRPSPPQERDGHLSSRPASLRYPQCSAWCRNPSRSAEGRLRPSLAATFLSMASSSGLSRTPTTACR